MDSWAGLSPNIRRIQAMGASMLYQIRVLQGDDYPTLITSNISKSDGAAILTARKLADGKNFEVWRGSQCIYALSRADQQPASLRPAN